MSRLSLAAVMVLLCAVGVRPAIALESLDDATMADQVGQAAGLVGVLRFNMVGSNQDIRYTDDGYGPGSTAASLLVDNLTLAKSDGSRIKLDFGLDVGFNSGDGRSALFLTANTSDSLKINFNSIFLDDTDAGNGNGTAMVGWTNAGTAGVTINNGFNITLRMGDELTTNSSRYLGALYGTMGYVTFTGLTLKDGDGSGELVLGDVKIDGASGTDAAINLGTAADPTKFALSNAAHANCGAVGVCVTLSGQTSIDASISNIRLGSASAPAVANLVVTGLNLGGTSITVGAH